VTARKDIQLLRHFITVRRPNTLIGYAAPYPPHELVTPCTAASLISYTL